MIATKPSSSPLGEFLKSCPSNFSRFLELVEHYKTIKCERKDCKYSPLKAKEMESLPLYDCPYYHCRTDFRRAPFTWVGENKSHVTLNYSPNVALEVLRGQKPDPEAMSHSINGYEYLYHPFNYKTKNCQEGQLGKCSTPYCPYFHSEDEKNFFATYRQELEKASRPLIAIEKKKKAVLKLDVGNSKHEELDKSKEIPNKVCCNPEKTIEIAQGKTIKDYYIFNQPVDLIEDHHHEFKCLKLHLDTVIKYVCGFLNSKGGTLYFGINNDGITKGTEVKEYEIKAFNNKLYEELKKFHPPVGEQEVKVKFTEIYSLNKNQTLSLIEDSYIIEFKIEKPLKNEVFFTNNNECFVKRSASINQLRTKEIKYALPLSLSL